MESEIQLESVRLALDGFGRSEKKLSVARLEHQETLLAALYGDQVLQDPARCHRAAVEVEQGLRDIIGDMADLIDRRIAQVVFASEPEFFGLRVGERKDYVRDNDRGFDDEQFAKRRRRIVRDVAVALVRNLAPSTLEGDSPLSPELRGVARRWYWWIQETSAFVEAFVFASRVANKLEASSALYPAAVRALTGRSRQSDMALWALVHCFDCVRVLDGDDAGRAFLRKFMPERLIHDAKSVPLHEYDAAAMRAILVGLSCDETWPFVEAVLAADFGPSAHAIWREVIGSLPPIDGRPNVGDHFKMTCLRDTLASVAQHLQSVFPEDVRDVSQITSGRAFELSMYEIWMAADLDRDLLSELSDALVLADRDDGMFSPNA